MADSGSSRRTLFAGCSDSGRTWRSERCFAGRRYNGHCAFRVRSCQAWPPGDRGGLGAGSVSEGMGSTFVAVEGLLDTGRDRQRVDTPPLRDLVVASPGSALQRRGRQPSIRRLLDNFSCVSSRSCLVSVVTRCARLKFSVLLSEVATRSRCPRGTARSRLKFALRPPSGARDALQDSSRITARSILGVRSGRRPDESNEFRPSSDRTLAKHPP